MYQILILSNDFNNKLFFILGKSKLASVPSGAAVASAGGAAAPAAAEEVKGKLLYYPVYVISHYTDLFYIMYL